MTGELEFTPGGFYSRTAVPKMIPEISTAVATLKTTLELLKTLNNVTQDEKVRSAIFELQGELLSLQTQVFDANARYEEQSERLKEVQKELDSKNRWEEEAQKFEIHHPAEGMTVYRLKPEHNTSGGEIWVCPNCFGNQKASFLNKLAVGNLKLKCHACGFEIQPERLEIKIPHNRRPGWMS